MSETETKLIGDLRPHLDTALELLRTPAAKYRLLKHISPAEYHGLMSELRLGRAIEDQTQKQLIDTMQNMKKNRARMIQVLASLKQKVSPGEIDGNLH